MYIEELNARNYVKCNNNICKVKQILSNNSIVLTDKNGTEIIIHNNVSEYIEPVEISKALLDSIFERDKEYYDKYSTVFENIIIYNLYLRNNPYHRKWHYLYNSKTNELRIEDDPCIIIKYVHQLQNLLKLLNDYSHNITL